MIALNSYSAAVPAFSHVAMYLRKSRADLELEASGGEDTLQRHRRVLLELARRDGLTVTRIYEEIVSGDTIDGRPQMQQLLRDVEAGAYDAVLCHDLDRLGRGAMRDQGVILETFKWSHTAIITPDRVYDLDADMDEEAAEFKALSARYEYRMIKKRLARGREASVREGKFIGNVAPYGYERYKLQGAKGWSLRPLEPAAGVVRDVYRWYLGETEPRIGVSLIVRRLNARGIPGPAGKDWTNCAVRSILSNPVYAGFIRSKNRPELVSMEDGRRVVHRPRSAAPEVYPGLHEPLITEAQARQAAELLANNKSRPGPRQAALQNPLAGLVICDQCGRAMVRRPYRSGTPDGLICAYTSCGCVGSALATVEDAVLDGLRQWLVSLDLSLDSAAGARQNESDLQSVKAAIDAAQAEAARLAAQKARAYDLVEQGVYTPAVFTERMTALGAEQEAVAEQISALTAECNRLEAQAKAQAELVPNVRRVLDLYPQLQDPTDKNALLRSVLSRILYHKTRRERWTGGSDLSLTLVPIVK